MNACSPRCMARAASALCPTSYVKQPSPHRSHPTQLRFEVAEFHEFLCLLNWKGQTGKSNYVDLAIFSFNLLLINCSCSLCTMIPCFPQLSFQNGEYLHSHLSTFMMTMPGQVVGSSVKMCSSLSQLVTTVHLGLGLCFRLFFDPTNVSRLNFTSCHAVCP